MPNVPVSLSLGLILPFASPVEIFLVPKCIQGMYLQQIITLHLFKCHNYLYHGTIYQEWKSLTESVPRAYQSTKKFVTQIITRACLF